MTELIVEIEESIDPVVFYGVNNINMQLLGNLYPNVKMSVRGKIIRLSGEANELQELSDLLRNLVATCQRTGRLEEEDILALARPDAHLKEKIKTPNSRLLYGVNGKAIEARTPNQKALMEAYAKDDLLFAVGPAGSGKTYTAIALAVKSLKDKNVRRIILSRPAVEAGEKLGFLPGDLKEKIDPYLQPLYDALQDMLPAAKLKGYLEDGTIQIAPLAYMRGRTLSDAAIILDEAQNTSPQQIKMFLTRMGAGSKIIVTGDTSQIDLPASQRSGLIDALDVLKNVKGVSIIRFGKQDIVRHKLVQRIVEAYDKQKTLEK